VLTLVEDAVTFLRKLGSTARREVIICLNALGADSLTDLLWRHFHGAPRRPAPTFLDAVAVLEEMGIEPGVEVVELATPFAFPMLEGAASAFRRELLLPDTDAVRGELRRVLGSWLIRGRRGLHPPGIGRAVAMLRWKPHPPAAHGRRSSSLSASSTG
jgi:hypothetical protein